jgi:hypothetical protein
MCIHHRPTYRQTSDPALSVSTSGATTTLAVFHERDLGSYLSEDLLEKSLVIYSVLPSGSVDNMDGPVAHDLIVGYCKGSQTLSRRATYRRTDPCLLRYASLV